MVNCHRMHLFDVVNQYRAIFNNDKSGSEENYDGGLLFSWAMHQISNHLSTLEAMLPKITEGGSLSNILDQCMVRIYLLLFRVFGYIHLNIGEIMPCRVAILCMPWKWYLLVFVPLMVLYIEIFPKRNIWKCFFRVRRNHGRGTQANTILSGMFVQYCIFAR